MSEFTPWAGLIGGASIGLAASVLLLGAGRVAGISGIAAGAFSRARDERDWRIAFVIGLMVAGLGFVWIAPGAFGASPRPLGALALAGLLVGVGTRLGSGCTSGHGVCGNSRLSPRSIVATLLFLAMGMLTVALLRGVGVLP